MFTYVFPTSITEAFVLTYVYNIWVNAFIHMASPAFPLVFLFSVGKPIAL